MFIILIHIIAITEQVQNALTAAVVRGIIGAVAVLVIVTPLVVVTCILKRNKSVDLNNDDVAHCSVST